ncbi:hypothetical protein [Haloarcula sediminis]|nr:hypothetical protein [Haloarcula sp. CK38]
MGDSDADDSFPWFLKVIIAVPLLVVLFIIGVDLLAFLEAW